MCKVDKDDALFEFSSDEEFKQFGLSRFMNPFSFFVFRAIVFIYCFAITLWSFVNMAVSGQTKFWFIYFTHWSIFIEAVYFALAFATTTKYYTMRPQKKEDAASYTTLIKVTWAFQEIIYPASFLVFLLYWLLVYSGGVVTGLGVHVHGVNVLLTFVDKYLSAAPFRFVHIWTLYLYATVFVVFSLIYFGAKGRNDVGDRYIYAALDYSAGGIAAAYIVVIYIVGVPLGQGICYGWEKLSKEMARRATQGKTLPS